MARVRPWVHAGQRRSAVPHEQPGESRGFHFFQPGVPHQLRRGPGHRMVHRCLLPEGGSRSHFRFDSGERRPATALQQRVAGCGMAELFRHRHVQFPRRQGVDRSRRALHRGEENRLHPGLRSALAVRYPDRGSRRDRSRPGDLHHAVALGRRARRMEWPGAHRRRGAEPDNPEEGRSISRFTR